MLCLNSHRKDAPFIYISHSSVLESALKQCFSAMEQRVVHSTNDFLSATNEGCTAYSPEKQHDLSVLMPLQQSVYVGCNSQRLQSRIEPHVSKPIRSPSYSNKRLFSLSRFKSSIQTNTQFLLLIQPLDFIFYQILPVLNIIMTVDFLFLPKAVLLSICLLLKPISSKLLTRPSPTKRISIQCKDCTQMIFSHK